MHICLNCGKYVFDDQDVNKFKRMTIEEYIDGVYRHTIRTNKSTKELITEFGLATSVEVNKTDCELCGAPHAVLSTDGRITGLLFFFSGTHKPSAKDKQFIEHFRRNFFSI